jgi:transcriptional regulator GlxA family with amidase domain
LNRRDFIVQTAAGAIAAFNARISTASERGASAGRLPVPKNGHIRAAFMLSEGANVIDTAGPWEVFQDVMWTKDGQMEHPFELYTVSESKQPLRMTAGLQVIPDYAIADAPQPHIVVVPAQRGSAKLHEWLRSTGAKTDVTMSVCTGAFQLGRAGLLKGKPATTHHDFWDRFAKEFPDIKLQRGLRFVDNGNIATAGGLTSGIDLALHIVSRYFGDEVAENTARYMEYQSERWRTERAG